MSGAGHSLSNLQSLVEPARQSGPLSAMDVRALILVMLAFLLAVLSFDRYRVLALLPFALFPVALAALGQVSFSAIAPRMLLAAPFALMVGVFNPWFDRAPMLDLLGLPISAGWVSFASIMIRFGLTVSAALVLVMSVGFDPLCAGLRGLGVPRVLTTQLQLLLRYAQVVGSEATRMMAAHELRSGGRRSLSLAVYGSLLGHLLLRSLARAQRIHLAMVSRGFDGDMRSLKSPRWRLADSIFLGAWVVFFMLARSVDLPRLLGLWLVGGPS